MSAQPGARVNAGEFQTEETPESADQKKINPD
jgi:hypothetical protein